MTHEEITEAIQSATNPEEAAAMYFVAAIKDCVDFNKHLDAASHDACLDESPMQYPTDEEIDALKHAMIEHLPVGIRAYADSPIDMARRAGFPLTTDFDPGDAMNQLIALAGIAPDSNIRRFLPSGTLRLLPTQIILDQRPIWSKEN